MHALQAWADRRGGRSLLAKRTGLTWQHVDRIIRGLVKPKTETAIALSRATDGEVSAAAILGLEPHRPTDGDEASPVNAGRPSSEDAA